MSAPAPAPNGMMNFTVRDGQFCASAGAAAQRISATTAARRVSFRPQFFGLKSIAFATAATLARCSSMESANSFGPPT